MCSNVEGVMKSLLSSTAVLTFALASMALVSSANATTISISSQNTTVIPVDSGVPAPAAGTTPVDYLTGVTTNTPTISLNPFENSTSPYSVLNQGTATVPLASVIFNAAVGGSNIFSIDWGSPDSYNTLEFWSGLGGTGTLLATYTGCSLTPACPGDGFDVVTFAAIGGTYGSVELTDTSQAAFEFSNVTTTPLPAALPLVAAGLGVLGFFSRRRKHRSVSAFAAA
jgi:PEP-CTERM motif-containing protein